MASLYPGVRLLLMIVGGLCFGLRATQAAGAGRAFPIASENYVIKNFQQINPRLEWDTTNFLVDLSGHYANCGLIGFRGSIPVGRQTPEGGGIAGYVDYTDGTDFDVNPVNIYLKRVIDRWMHERQLNYQIKGAKRFGCSVRPGCSGGRVVVSCLFSPAKAGNNPSSPLPIRPTEPGSQPAPQYALAFTTQQYDIAENLLNTKWDHSHFLENLSGSETNCGMIGNDDWQFTQAASYSMKYRRHLDGICGSALNEGSTQDALESILIKFKKMHRAKHVGCSLIPDCRHEDGQTYVVVSCIYEK